jgi:lipoate-protein ligase B
MLDLALQKVPVEIKRHSVERPWTYALLDRRQREIAARARLGEKGALLLSEVSPVVTKGRRTPGSDLILAPEILKARGIEVLETDRGGLATYHGPGQWVVFVVDRLEALTGDRRGVRRAVEGLLAVGHEVARQYDPTAEIRSGAHTGVWCKSGKLGSVGVHIDDHVVLHGLAINVYRTPFSFMGIRPCGLDEPVSFVCREAGTEERVFEEVAGRIVTAVFRNFWK